jgi:hypothetical protein
VFDEGVGDGLWRSVIMIRSSLKNIIANYMRSGKEMRKYFEKIEHNNYLASTRYEY